MRTLGRLGIVSMTLALAASAATVSVRAIQVIYPPQATPATPATKPAAPPSDYAFPSGLGMFFFYVKPDKTADFEAVVGKLSEVLNKSTDPQRKQQAASWRIFKSAETPKDELVYVFFFDPAVTGAEYDPVRVLGEGVPAEVQGLYDRLKDAVIRVERMGLTKIR